MTDTRDTDPKIARLFEAQRLADEAAAPDLDALLARPARRRLSDARAIRRIAFGAAAVAAAVTLVLLRRDTSLPRGPASAASGLPSAAMEIASWKAPTDALLRTPGSDLWTEIPELTPAVPGYETGISLETTKGVER